jgi:Homeodomain-like domain
MSSKDVAVKKYVVRLSAEEREYLDQLIRKGKSSAQRLMKARILLKADIGEGGEGWSDNKIIEVLGTSVSMLYRVRKQLVEEGLEVVLSRKQRAMPAVPKIFDGERGETHCFGLLRTSQGTCPLDVAAAGREGRRAEDCRQGQRQYDRTISKKTFSNPTSRSNGLFRPRRTAHS